MPIIIRDARNAKDPRQLGTEGYEMQYLNAVRAAIDIAKIEGKPELEQDLKKQAVNFIENFNKDNENRTQEEISINVKNKVNNIAIFLEEKNIKEVHKKLNVAKDFQNFNDEHHNIATISTVTDKNGKNHTIIEAEVALKGLTEEQQKEYDSIKDENKPKWYTKMPDWESELVKKYAPKITSGGHVIPTQLRQIVGMKNAFEKITAIAEDDKPLEVIHTSKHAGTLASISRDKNSQQRITILNARQAQEWMGKDRVSHANTLNSGSADFEVPHPDARLVILTKKAMDHVGGHHTNTAFNKFRKIAGFNNLNGTKEQLNDLANNLPKEGNFSSIASHLKPRSKLERLFGMNKPKGDLQGLLDIAVQTHNLSPETVKTLQNAANLKKDVEKADVLFYRGADKENISSDISRKLNYLSHQISNSNDFIFLKVPKHETLTMCASGKDRTGLAEHDQTSTAIANRLGIEVQDVDRQLLKAGHTANQAGGVYAGGATIGCYGTLKVTAAGFPESREEALKTMIEPTGANNKIKKLEKDQIINEPKEQEKAQETPNMYQTESYVTTLSVSQQKTIKNTQNLDETTKLLSQNQQKTLDKSKNHEVLPGDIKLSSTPNISTKQVNNQITRL